MKRDYKYVYNHGLPYDKTLHKNLVEQKERIEMNKASMILIDGGVGEGKTTLAVHVLDSINALYGKKPLDLDAKETPQYAMGGEDFLKKLVKCYERKLPCIIYDAVSYTHLTLPTTPYV